MDEVPLPRRRFRVASLEPGAADEVALDGGVLRHLKVLRVARGDLVRLFDGRGLEVEAEIVALDEGTARARIRRETGAFAESPLCCWLVQALPARRARMDVIVRQVTELGVHRIVPLVAARSQQPGSADALLRRAERWRRIATSAAEQCGRVEVPEIDAPCGFDALPWERLPRPLLIAVPGGPSWSAADPPAGEAPRRDAAVMVGPEGGWTEEEAGAARRNGAVAIGLGPRILRADTAGVVAVALLQHRLGDL